MFLSKNATNVFGPQPLCIEMFLYGTLGTVMYHTLRPFSFPVPNTAAVRPTLPFKHYFANGPRSQHQTAPYLQPLADRGRPVRILLPSNLRAHRPLDLNFGKPCSIACGKRIGLAVGNR